jgi:deoxyribodipyrimidine photolyase
VVSDTGRRGAGILEQALPGQLLERTQFLSKRVPRRAGEFVLYWAHHALRVDENAALDTAARFAQALDLPLVVYQLVNADTAGPTLRQAAFLMESAADFEQALSAEGVQYVCEVTGSRGAGSLVRLARRAAVVVSECFPMPPFTNWMTELVEMVDAPVVWCDAFCVTPMFIPPRLAEQRNHFERMVMEEERMRLRKPWEPTQLPSSADVALHVTHTSPASADVERFARVARLDMTVLPVAETPGGTRAGMARWEQFLKHGLRNYDRTRNDPTVLPPRGPSRMSPYLLFGCVSPLALTRDAAIVVGDGSKRYRLSLLTRRELAYHFCYFVLARNFKGKRCSADAAKMVSHLWQYLPEWALATLEKHEEDPRPGCRSEEQLSAGEVVDRYFPLIQAQLRLNGELAHVLRTYWGKAILEWSASPRAAAEAMLRINRRYALDGGSPAAVAGVFWCLGLFDKPSDPPCDIFGRVRPRTGLIRRLDPEALRMRINWQTSANAD